VWLLKGGSRFTMGVVVLWAFEGGKLVIKDEDLNKRAIE
jgi:hypothetical protein